MTLEPQPPPPLGRQPISHGCCCLQLGSEPLQPQGIPTCGRHRNRRVQPFLLLKQVHRLQLVTIAHQSGKHQRPPALPIPQQIGQVVAHTQAQPRLQQLVVPGGGKAQPIGLEGLTLPATGPAAPVVPLPPGLPAVPELCPAARQAGRHKPVQSSSASASTPSRQRRASTGSIDAGGSRPWL